MYAAIGTYRLKAGEARLDFDTLDAALSKIRDWIEADEIDTDEDAPMFSRYSIVVNPPPRRVIEDPPKGPRLVTD
jgi:hypothetical protein